MSTQFQPDLPDPYDARPPSIAWSLPTLPRYLARRLLRPNETVTLVRGPRSSPSWEPFVTHPGLFLVALVLGAICVTAGRLMAATWAELHPVAGLLAFGVVIGSIIVLAFFNAFFTRLVVTNQRLFILQGFEVRRSWRIEDLPRSLLRYTRQEDGAESRTVDLDALQSMLGTSSTQFAESKSIRLFGKHLNRIKSRKDDRD